MKETAHRSNGVITGVQTRTVMKINAAVNYFI
jgi:hypothetical protein